jgi:hypothetical protein
MSDILKDLADEMARLRGAFERAPARRKRNLDT